MDKKKGRKRDKGKTMKKGVKKDKEKEGTQKERTEQIIENPELSIKEITALRFTYVFILKASILHKEKKVKKSIKPNLLLC
jgi:hypothetical protein